MVIYDLMDDLMIIRELIRSYDDIGMFELIGIMFRKKIGE